MLKFFGGWLAFSSRPFPLDDTDLQMNFLSHHAPTSKQTTSIYQQHTTLHFNVTKKESSRIVQ